jgi:hypothetical protein
MCACNKASSLEVMCFTAFESGRDVNEYHKASDTRAILIPHLPIFGNDIAKNQMI